MRNREKYKENKMSLRVDWKVLIHWTATHRAAFSKAEMTFNGASKSIYDFIILVKIPNAGFLLKSNLNSNIYQKSFLVANATRSLHFWNLKPVLVLRNYSVVFCHWVIIGITHVYNLCLFNN